MQLNMEQFKNPGAEFRGKPFWAWNCRLDKENMLRQMEYFKEMGMGGVTIHCRTGLDTEYLGPEFLDVVKACVKKAEDMGIQVCLYDEDRWPSGYGGGRVTCEEKYRARYLVFSPKTREQLAEQNRDVRPNSTARAFARGNGKLLAKYEILLERGKLKEYRRLDETETGRNVWYAWLETAAPSPWFNNETYVNTLDKKAVERFLETTYQVYYDAVGEKFGETIPSIFTDEPQFTHKTMLGKADGKEDLILPYTDDFEETFRKEYGDSFLDHLPEVFWESVSGDASVTRYRYHDHVAERFARAYCDTLGDWCKKHNIALTGHMMEEPTLQTQTGALGEAMRHYRAFQIPGIDMLCDWREYTTAKQAQSAAAQMGKKQITSELYGVTNWDFDFRGHKLQGDWQAALGVTNRVHHLAWASMEGEAKRDYPASVFYQSPWYKAYEKMETYFSRINTVLQSGQPHVRIGVIHPIESFWISFGPEEHTAVVRERLERQFQNLTEWLLFGLQDFHFISESLLQRWETEQDRTGFRVGTCEYDVVVVPGCLTLRKSTVRQLEQFVSHGGRVMFLGSIPTYVDAVRSSRVQTLAGQCVCMDFEESMLLDSLQPFREIDITDERGCRIKNHICQLRDLGEDRVLFVANGGKEENRDVPSGIAYEVSITGEYDVTELDPMTGETKELTCTYKEGRTRVSRKLYDHDSLLLHLRKGRQEWKERKDRQEIPMVLTDSLHLTEKTMRNEPNVLLLDQAEYSLDGEPFRKKEETLRIDNILRKELGYPLKMEALAQPWTERLVSEEPGHIVRLKYIVCSETEVKQAWLAVEHPELCEILWNGQKAAKTEGFFVDECIKKVVLPGVQKGENELVVTMPYNRKSNLEWCYLLGEFGVEVQGRQALITELPDTVAYADLTMQKFPFYAGNFSWISEVDVEPGTYWIEITKFRTPLIRVEVDGKTAGEIACSPYRVCLGQLTGRHTVKITAYGNRRNAFGTIHNCDDNTFWFGPEAWRTEGCSYSYEYQMKPFGILSAPKIWKEE